MVNNHKKLNGTEISALVFACVGIALISSMLSPNIGIGIQQNIVSAMQIFDFSESYKEPLEVPKFVLEAQESFLEEFYIAFTEVARIPENDIQEAIVFTDQFFAYSESLAKNYSDLAYEDKNYTLDIALVLKEMNQGRVAGISTESKLNNSESVDSGYEKPNLNEIKNKFILMYARLGY